MRSRGATLGASQCIKEHGARRSTQSGATESQPLLIQLQLPFAAFPVEPTHARMYTRASRGSRAGKRAECFHARSSRRKAGGHRRWLQRRAGEGWLFRAVRGIGIELRHTELLRELHWFGRISFRLCPSKMRFRDY